MAAGTGTDLLHDRTLIMQLTDKPVDEDDQDLAVVVDTEQHPTTVGVGKRRDRRSESLAGISRLRSTNNVSPYTEQNERDYQALEAAVNSGSIAAEAGL